MGQDNANDIYEEIEDLPISYEVGVRDVGRFLAEMLKHFNNKGTLYISSYDFGGYANKLESLKSNSKVRTKTLFVPPSLLENGYGVTEEFTKVFVNECLNGMDARNTLNQFVIYDKGTPLLQCYGNFEVVLVNAKVPKSIVESLMKDGAIESWNERA